MRQINLAGKSQAVEEQGALGHRPPKISKSTFLKILHTIYIHYHFVIWKTKVNPKTIQLSV